MEPIAVVLSLIVPFAFFLLARRGSDNPEVGVSVAREAAGDLGLEARGERYGTLLEGGHNLELWARPEGRGQLGERVTARVTLRKPLATEINVVPTAGELPSQVSAGYDFDLRYRVTSAHPERAERLLRGRLSMELVAADAAGYTVELHSDHLLVTSRWVTSVGDAVRTSERAQQLARHLLAAERALPELVPWRNVARAWATAAERIGARFDRDARVLVRVTPFGKLEGHPSSEREERWFATLKLTFERPLPARFIIADEGARSLWQRWTERDLEIGHKEFDAVFHIVSEEGDKLRALLELELRDLLLELERRTGTILVNELMIEARLEAGGVTDVERLTSALDALLNACEVLDRAARPKAQGAYR